MQKSNKNNDELEVLYGLQLKTRQKNNV